MGIEIRVPALGESVTEATVGKWFKKPGDAVKADEPLVELETDKVTVEVPSPVSGVMGEIMVKQGATVAVGSLLAALREGAARSRRTCEPSPLRRPQPAAPQSAAAEAGSGNAAKPGRAQGLGGGRSRCGEVQGSGKRGQVLKERCSDGRLRRQSRSACAGSAPQRLQRRRPFRRLRSPRPCRSPIKELRLPSAANDAAREERVRMTRLRQTIARRLKDAQNTAAMLTTFNDVDMSAVMALRNQYKDLFEKRHGVKLGFMGVVREGLHPGAARYPRRQRRDRRRRDHLQELLSHRRRGRHREGPRGAGRARCRPHDPRRDRDSRSANSASARATASSASRTCRAAHSRFRTAASTAR